MLNTSAAESSSPLAARDGAGVYLFEDLDHDQRQWMMRSVRPVALRRGEWLFAQDDLARRFYLVRTGGIALFRQSHTGEEKIIAVIEAGETFGEEPVFVPDGTYSLNAKAVSETSLLAFDNEQLRSLLSNSVDLCLKLMATLRRREGFLLDEIEQICLRNATQRVVAYLLQRTDDVEAGNRVHLSIPKHMLASRLTIKPETLSRVLGRLRAQELIRLDGEAIAIVDRKTLEVENRCLQCNGRSWGCPGPSPLGSPAGLGLRGIGGGASLETSRTHNHT